MVYDAALGGLVPYAYEQALNQARNHGPNPGDVSISVNTYTGTPKSSGIGATISSWDNNIDNWMHNTLLNAGLPSESDPTINTGWHAFGIFAANANLGVALTNLYSSFTSGKSIFNEELSKKEATFWAGVSLIPVAGAFRASARGRVFWSGGKGVMKAAANFAEANGMQTLEMTLSGRIMTSLKPILSRSISDPIWKLLSIRWTQGARGAVNVFHNANGIRVDAIWKVEYEILKSNPVNIIYNNIFTK
jgi:hypothetical protein